MRTHVQVLKDVGDLGAFAARLGVSMHTARSWKQRKRIPVEHWKALADAQIATLEELAADVADTHERVAA